MQTAKREFHGHRLPWPDSEIIQEGHNVFLYLDNAKCVEVLRVFDPSCIDEIPQTASLRREDGLGTIVTTHFRAPTFGVLVSYHGYGFPADDNGWTLLLFDAKTEEQFNSRLDGLLKTFKFRTQCHQ